MAKQTSPITFIGKLGNLVGSKGMKGNQILRQKPTSVANPQTPKQVANRARFLAASHTANIVPIEAIAGMRPLAKSRGISLRNAYASTLMNDRIISEAPGFDPMNPAYGVTELSKIIFSKGNQPNMAYGAPQFDDPLTVEVTGTKLGTLTDTDIVHVIVYNPEVTNAPWVHQSFPVSDVLDGAQVTVPSTWNGMKVHVYAYTQTLAAEDADYDYFANIYGANAIERELVESRSSYSNTAYIGTGNIG